MKLMISSFTPLFFPYTAQYASKFSKTIFLQGFFPSKVSFKLLKLVDFFFKVEYSKKILKRIPKNYQGRNIGIAIPEFLLILGLKFLKDKPKVQYKTHILYGFLSKLYIKDVDIFHVRSGSGGGGAIKKAQNKGAIVIVDHSIAHPKKMEDILFNEYAKFKIPYDFSNCFWDLVINNCIQSDYIVVNSDFVKDSFVENGFDDSKIKVIYLGVREDFWGLKKQYKIENEVNLLFIGAFGFRKGCEYLLKSLDIIEQRGINYRLTVIGPIDNFEPVIKKHNTARINFLGGIPYDGLKQFYSNSDIFIFPSLCEGSTMAGMEAMSAGLPCIFTENCGVPVVDRENGLVVAIKDEYAIADAVELLYKNEWLREKIGLKAIETIKGNYKWEDYQNNLKNFYNEILTEKQRI